MLELVKGNFLYLGKNYTWKCFNKIMTIPIKGKLIIFRKAERENVMEKIDIAMQRRIQLEMLTYISEICEKNGIDYSLCGGTLIGAIRHKGFVPWDDDIDIFLIRPEYERLMKILKRDNDFVLVTSDTPGYYYTFAKLMNKRTILETIGKIEAPIPHLGVYIDIFPIDGVPNTKEEQESHVANLNDIAKKLILSMHDTYYINPFAWKSFVKRILLYPLHRKTLRNGTPDQWKERLLREYTKYSFQQSEYVGNVIFSRGICEIFPRSFYEKTIDIEFEGHSFKCIANYDEYLRAAYGDYTKLPPENERICHSYYIAYWKD